MLSFTDPANLRVELANALDSASTEVTSWQLGQQVDTLSCAFLVGYQAAMRCLNPNLASNVWAAYCVSEKGVKSPFEMTSQYCPKTHHLRGAKSHVMLASSHLMDELYIVARELNSDGADVAAEAKNVTLLALKVPMSAVTVESSSAQAFLPELPHDPICFDTTLTANAVFSRDAHHKINKPFRYWEDVHLCLAFGGWLASHIADNARLIREAERLQAVFSQNPSAYNVASLDAVEHFLAVLRDEAMQLNDDDSAAWSRDTLMLKFSQAIRTKIRHSLTALT